MNGHQIHVKAEVARENDELVKALTLVEEALVAYQKEEDYEGFSQALQSRVLTCKHLFLLTKDNVFAILAKKDAEASLEITLEHKIVNRIGSCYFRLGEVAMLFKNYKLASDYYQKALDNYSGTKAEKGDYRYHLGEALYRKGQREEGKKVLLEGLREIKDNAGEVDPFLTHVWESGCLMRLAQFLKGSDESKKYLGEAEKIINNDPKLVIRKRQLEELKKSLEK
jgi:tetratricopeptide (TPR) repeat protein